MSETLTAQQRANLFAMSTRQNLQMLPKQTAKSGATSLQFSLPKSRLLSGLSLLVKAKISVKHASLTELTINEISQYYRLIRRISLDLNNGFSPYVLSGEECFMYNLLNRNGNVLLADGAVANDLMHVPGKLTASESGAVNNVEIFIDLPVTTNPRDPIGLILLQNDQTNVTLTVDIANASEMFTTVPGGFTIELASMDVTPVVETFSIPANANAYPDLSVLKLCNGRNDAMPSAGQQIIKLSTGTIYRKLLIMLTKSDGTPMGYDEVTSNFELVFNQADVNYSIAPEMLHALNTRDLGFDLPKGMYVFDFSAGGNITNYGGSRDFIDTERLTEFWIRFNTNVVGKCKIVTECLARLQ